MSVTASFDQIAATTLANYRRQFADNISSNISLLWVLREAGRIEPEDGGKKIREPLMYQLGTIQSFEKADILDTDEVEGLGYAEFERKFADVPIIVFDTDLTANMGRHQIIDLLKTKIEQAEITMEEGMEQMLFGDGTGSGGKDMNGLQNLVEVDTSTASTTTPTAVGSGTVGGIARGTYTWWKVYNNDGAKTTTKGDNLLEAMRLMSLKLSRGKRSWDFAITTDTVAEIYESLLFAKGEFDLYVKGKAADAGFDVMTFKGRPIFRSDYCPSGYMYMLNSNYLKFRPNMRWNFITTEFRKPAKQLARYAYIVVGGNMTVSNCARQGLIHSIT